MINKSAATFTGEDMMNFEQIPTVESYSSPGHQPQIGFSAERPDSVKGFFNAFVFSLLFWTALILSVIYF